MSCGTSGGWHVARGRLEPNMRPALGDLSSPSVCPSINPPTHQPTLTHHHRHLFSGEVGPSGSVAPSTSLLHDAIGGGGWVGAGEAERRDREGCPTPHPQDLTSASALDEKRNIRLSFKSMELQVTIGGLDDELMIRWQAFVRERAKDLMPLPFEDDLFPNKGPARVPQEALARRSGVPPDFEAALGGALGGPLPHRHSEEAGLVGQRRQGRQDRRRPRRSHRRRAGREALAPQGLRVLAAHWQRCRHVGVCQTCGPLWCLLACVSNGKQTPQGTTRRVGGALGESRSPMAELGLVGGRRLECG